MYISKKSVRNHEYFIALYLICHFCLTTVLFSKEDNNQVIQKTFRESRLAKRHRRKMLNIQITFLAWLAETFGFFFIVFGTYILGHENNIATFSMQNITIFIYFNILPIILILNDLTSKDRILESTWYDRFLTTFRCNYNNKVGVEEPGNERNEENANEQG